MVFKYLTSSAVFDFRVYKHNNHRMIDYYDRSLSNIWGSIDDYSQSTVVKNGIVLV